MEFPPSYNTKPKGTNIPVFFPISSSTEIQMFFSIKPYFRIYINLDELQTIIDAIYMFGEHYLCHPPSSLGYHRYKIPIYQILKYLKQAQLQ